MHLNYMFKKNCDVLRIVPIVLKIYIAFLRTVYTRNNIVTIYLFLNITIRFMNHTNEMKKKIYYFK